MVAVDYIAPLNTVDVTLSGSETGVTYTLNPGALTMTGTGSTLAWSSLIAGTYTVSAVSGAGCTATMSGSAIATALTTPTASIDALTTTICEGGTATITGTVSGVKRCLYAYIKRWINCHGYCLWNILRSVYRC